MQNHLVRPFHHFQRPVRGGSIALVAALLLAALLYTELAEVARAAITTSGNLTGLTGTPYNGTDNPWHTTNLVVGNTAPGSMTISSGSVVNNAGIGTIASLSGASTSTVTVGGGVGSSRWTTVTTLTVGFSGTGTLHITGGGSVSDGGSLVGGGTGSNGTVTVGGGTGASTWTNSGGLTVGGLGTGTLTITGGGSVSNAIAIIGQQSGSNGTVTVGGGTGASTWINSSALFVGSGGTGKLDITGGGSVSDTAGVVGQASGSNGTVTVGGGTGASTWTNSGVLTVGDSGTGTLNVNTGGLVIATALNGGNATSSVKFNGGTLRITATDSATNTINLSAGGGTFDVPTAATTFTVDSAISGAGGLTKTGGATLALSAANTYLGNTTVHAGTLKLSGVGGIASSPKIIVGDAGSTGTHLDVTTKTGGLTIGAAQTLAGIGTVDGNTTIRGTHSPGNSPGVQTLNGDMIYATGSTLAWELAANKSTDTTGTRGLDFDGVNVAGGLTIGPGVTSSLIFNGAGSTVNFANSFWNTSHSWLAFSDASAPLLSSGSIFDTITVSTDSVGATLSGGAFSWGEVGNNVNLNYTVSAVPEPGTVVVWGLAILSLALSSKYLRKLAA
jgi:fibronectin-binding autotransporter adhesin